MKDFTLARFHHFRFLIRFMIVPQKMQKAMYNEVGEVIFDRLALFLRLALPPFRAR